MYMFLINHIKCCSTVTVKDTSNAQVRVIYDAKEVISRLHTPFVKDSEVLKYTYISLSCVV